MGIIRINCDVEELPPGQWIEGSDLITRGMKKRWFQEPDDFKSEKLVLEFVSNWRLFNMDGTDAPAPTTVEAFNGLHERQVSWVYRAVSQLIGQAAQLNLKKSSA